MSISEYLGWANSIIIAYGLDNYIKVGFIIAVAATVIMRLRGRGD